MNKRERLFSKRKIVVLSVILLAAIVTTGLLSVPPGRTIALIAYFAVVPPIQESFQQRRLLCSTDHQALLNECRRLSKQIASENANPGLEVCMTPVPASKLSEFPIIKKLGGRVAVYNDGGATIGWGGTFRHFSIEAYPEDSTRVSSSSVRQRSELVPGLWYYDDRYSRDENYDKVVERLLRKNKARKN